MQRLDKNNGHGRLFVLEGIDGSGKSTQFKALCSRLESENRQFEKLVFPRYDKPSSALIRMYLGGEFGSRPDDVNPYAASMFYAADRYAAFHGGWADEYRKGTLFLSDRYTTSNAVHQGAKVASAQLDSFLDWLFDFEYGKLALPEPDLVIYLDADIKTAAAAVQKRREGSGSPVHDIHELDFQYLAKCIETGRQAAKLCSWKIVSCGSDGIMRGIDDIHEEIYSIIEKSMILDS